jgi:hypothetical protein
MGVERLSRATVYDPDQRVIQTDERGLLIDGEIRGSIFNADDKSLDDVVLGVVGAKNHTYHLDMNTWPGNEHSIGEHADALRIDFDWYRHVLGRELAIRSIEMSILTDAELSPDIATRTMILTEGTRYDRLGRIRSNKPDIGFMKKWTKKDLDEGDRSLGDFLARERVYTENGMLTRVSLLLSAIADTQPHLRLGKRMDYRQQRRKKELSILNDALDSQEGLAQADRFFAGDLVRVDSIHESLLSGQEADALATVKSLMEAIKRLRARSTSFQLDTTPEAWYHYFPSNTKLYEDARLVAPVDQKSPRADQVFAPVSEADREALAEKVASQRAAEEARRAEERERKAAQKEAAQEHDAPILEELNRIAVEYNGIIDEFIGQSSRSLREKGFAGKDSLEYALPRINSINQEEASRIVRVYAKLHDLAERCKGESRAILTEQLLRLEQLQAEYSIYLQEHPLQGTLKPTRLDTSVKPELAWLTQHFVELQDIISQTRHAAFYTDEQYRNIATMLGIEIAEEDEEELPTVNDESTVYDETPTQESTTVEQPSTESPLVQANRLAEQLNWVVLPNESITPDDLVNIAEKTIRERSGDDKKPAVVERYRMEALLRLREEYGGVLYRSDERTLGDSDNLYFVLRFQHPGDDNHYAVAENPVYGNATYVLREDALPLQPGETVLAAVRLSRRDVQYFGAQRIIHGTPDLETHQEKINDRIVRLSEREAVASA